MTETIVARVFRHIIRFAESGIFTGSSRDIGRALGIAHDTAKSSICALRDVGRIDCIRVASMHNPWELRIVDTAPMAQKPPSGLSDSQKAEFRRLWNEGMTSAKIAQRLGTTKSAITGMRQRMKLPTRGNAIRVGAPLPEHVMPLPRWLSPAADRLVLEWHATGCLHATIAAAFNVTATACERRHFNLKHPKERRGDKKRTQEVDATRTIIARQTRSPAGRGPVVVQSSGWSMGKLPTAQARAEGQCAWPLTCDAPASGRYCEYHARLAA